MDCRKCNNKARNKSGYCKKCWIGEISIIKHPASEKELRDEDYKICPYCSKNLIDLDQHIRRYHKDSPSWKVYKKIIKDNKYG
jgi:hypothetical protein